MWWLTGANLCVVALFVLYIFAVISALAAFAAGVEAWPAYVLLPIGISITILAMSSVLTQSARKLSRASLAINGVISVFYIVLFLGFGLMRLRSTRRLFLVPAQYRGNLYLVHSPRVNVEQRWHWKRKVYTFSSTGLLQTDDPEPTFFSDEYELVFPDGHRVSVPDAGPGTLPNTPENLANDVDVVAYFPRTTSGSGLLQCVADEISIGTRTFLLSLKREPPMPALPNPDICRGNTR